MNESPYGPPPDHPQQPAQPATPYGPPPGVAPQQQAFAPGQPQYGQQQQYGQQVPGQPQQQQFATPQYGQPQYGEPAAPYASPYGAPKPGRRGKGAMIAGPLIFLAGLLITVVSYGVAAPGGTYIVSFGPMIWGVIMFIRGLVAYNSSR